MIILKTVTDFEFVFGQRLKSQAQDGSLVLAVQEVKKGLCPLVSISFLFTGIFSLGGPALFFLLLKKNPSSALCTSIVTDTVHKYNYLNGWLLCDADPPP